MASSKPRLLGRHPRIRPDWKSASQGILAAKLIARMFP